MRVMKRKFSSSAAALVIFASLVAGGLFFTACKKSNNDGVNIPVAALMAFNLAPDKPAIGINLSGSSMLASPLTYAGYTGNYLTIYTGNRTIEAISDNNTPFTSSQYNFDTSKYYSLFVIGNNGKYQNLVVNDNVDSLSAINGSAYIRYINAIPDSSKPSVTITAGGNNIVNANPGFATVSSFVTIPAGDIQVGASNESNIITSRTINLQEKKVYTILLMGNPAATDSTGKVQIRFVQNGGL